MHLFGGITFTFYHGKQYKINITEQFQYISGWGFRPEPPIFLTFSFDGFSKVNSVDLPSVHQVPTYTSLKMELAFLVEHSHFTVL